MINSIENFENINNITNIVITYDNIINMREINLFYNFILPNYDKFIKNYKLELFTKNITLGKLTRYLDLRKDKDINKWLLKPDCKAFDFYNRGEYKISTLLGLTNFAGGLTNLLSNVQVKKIIILVDTKDVGAIQIIKNTYGDFLQNKIFLVNYSKESFVKYLLDPIYNLVITDESEIVSEYCTQIKGKTICIPYTGYNFIKEKCVTQYSNQILYNKDLLEFKSLKYEFNVGFMELFDSKRYSIK